MSAPNLLEAQPAPIVTDSPAVWPTVADSPVLALPDWLRDDMRARHELGLRRYGTALQVVNGRNPVRDAYEEVLDLVVYAQQARLRMGPMTLKGGAGTVDARLTLDLAFHTGLQLAQRLGALLRSPHFPAVLR